MTMTQEKYDTILDTIGKTPLVRLQHINPNPLATILVKVEYMNPGSSIKDRIVLHIINDAEQRGLLKPGGTLVYCTCSLEPEEGEAAIAALLAAESGLRRAAIAPAEVAGLTEIITADGDLRTLPCHLPEMGGMDGFYIARLKRLA